MNLSHPMGSWVNSNWLQLLIANLKKILTDEEEPDFPDEDFPGTELLWPVGDIRKLGYKASAPGRPAKLIPWSLAK